MCWEQHYPINFYTIIVFFLILNLFFFPCRVTGRLLEPLSAAYGPGGVHPWIRS